MAHDKRGRPREYVNPAEANRQRQQRHRDKQLALRSRLQGGALASALAQCVKCNSCARLTRQHGCPVVCPDCQRVRDTGLAKQNLTETRASTTHAGPIVNSGPGVERVDRVYEAGERRGAHGRSVTHSYVHDAGKDGWETKKVGRYTDGEKVRDKLQQGVELVTDQKKVQRYLETPYMANLRSAYVRRLTNSMEYILFRGKHPGMSHQQILAALRETDFGKTLWQMVLHGERV